MPTHLGIRREDTLHTRKVISTFSTRAPQSVIFLTAMTAGGIANPPKASCLFCDEVPAAVTGNSGNHPLGEEGSCLIICCQSLESVFPHSFSILSNCYWASMMTVLRPQQRAHLTRSLPSLIFHCSDVSLSTFSMEMPPDNRLWTWWPCPLAYSFLLQIVRLYFPVLKLHYLETFLRLLLVLLFAQYFKMNFLLPWDVNRSYEMVHKIK